MWLDVLTYIRTVFWVFSNTVDITVYTQLNDMTDKLGSTGNWSTHNLSAIPAFSWKNLETSNDLSQDSQCPSWDSKQGPPEYESRTLAIHQPLFFNTFRITPPPPQLTLFLWFLFAQTIKTHQKQKRHSIKQNILNIRKHNSTVTSKSAMWSFFFIFFT
jgi:hypothetical protein